MSGFLTRLKVRHFRCFEALECEFAPEMNLFVGPNAQGKTSLLEGVCVLLRLQSPRVSTLARAIQHERRGFVLDGHFGARHMQFYFGKQRKKLALDSVEQKSAQAYLEIAGVVWFSNADIELVRGGAEGRRKFLDFVGMQADPGYRPRLRAYEKALHSRNRLLKMPRPNWREIEAFNRPLAEAGNYLIAARAALIDRLQPAAAAVQRRLGHSGESLKMEYHRGGAEDFAAALESGRAEDARLRQTCAGPHRDDIIFFLNGRGPDFSSEGQQRSLALALKLAQARLLEQQTGRAPVLLMDDVFGELDVRRRNALLHLLPSGSQKFVTTTHLDWLARMPEGRVFSLSRGGVQCRG
jgi:DNA replication and repair protein RecF